MLDVHPGVYSAAAKGLLLDWLEVASVDDVLLALSPHKRFQVLLHLLSILKDEPILLNPLISERVDHDLILPMRDLPAGQRHLAPLLERDDGPPDR